uniref:phospholipase D n=1 Tax=Tanacetum cinerariifolium TaxID=118510 RepID=A0A6L2JXU7_TANCI|nr:phospholipase D beta 1-like [Tanacetum cinerariifolium]
MAEPVDEGSQHSQGVQVVPFRTPNASLKVVLLHGNLDICVKNASHLPNRDSFNEKFKMLLGTSDPYVTISVANAVIGRTYVVNNSENPVWMQRFNVHVAHYTSEVLFVVKDNDVIGSKLIGAVGIPAGILVSDSVIEGTFPILNASGHPCKLGAVLTLSIQYTPVEKMALYGGGVGPDPDLKGVPGTYFPLRRGGKVTLYQDAHVDGSVPSFKLDRGVMQTRDEETRVFFKYSKVQVLLCPRSAGKGSWTKKDGETIYTHHQNSVIVDADAGIKRRIAAFVGGLDLCRGRYDTPEHSLYSTLHTLHKDDYHNPNYKGSTVGCPREPWHDLHCRIEGPV